MESERILGQNHILRHFENAIRMGKISHAYIINGEEGSGKMNLAIHFAKALQCERNNFNKAINEDGERITVPGTACGQCKSCKQTDSKNQPDIKYITYEKSGIGVDEIREQINDDIDIKPYSSPYKIYIVPESEKMTVQAQNALLKTIEEPPEYAIIILLTTNADTFLQTILSRCVMLNIRPVKEDIIKNQLTSQYGVGDYEARVAATFSNGNPGKAIKLATSEEFKELKQYVVGMFMSLEKGGMDIIGEAIKKTGTFKKQIDEYFSLMRIWFRDILVYKATKEEDQIIFQDEYMTIEKMSQTYSFDDINDILKAIDLAESRIKSNVNFDSTIEILLLSIKEKTSGK
ncbi:ATP-binding protein [Eubacterium ventriosum]|jgi:DNA polymerase-3 subunit delta'|uniref:DNA polymerase III subunit n=1 Tax=Eubacterium ventriosum TaxID=39496 RepID=UPI000E4FB95F|nr:DNA polymerase III subunit [Eubacterium ventriosum]MCQ5339569.1 DNA polymerase III subunit [Eubacterium ventriosum]RHD11602.1 DNA polymerase III subunit delta [Eubacterium ventriosum]